MKCVCTQMNTMLHGDSALGLAAYRQMHARMHGTGTVSYDAESIGSKIPEILEKTVESGMEPNLAQIGRA